ncbi:MAG: mechanosensitive ion channel, partial [Bacteroidales bacterium]|nr:mechanosensitive ion channel [Bacteroidales bacterium]
MGSLSGQGVLSRENQLTQEQTEADTVQILPIPSTRISEAFNESFSLINELNSDRITEDALKEYNIQIDTLVSVVDYFLGDSSLRSLEGTNVRELDNIVHRSDYYTGELSRIKDRLSKNASETENAAELLLLTKKRWELTLERMDDDEIPESRLTRIERIMHQTDSVRNILMEDLDAILFHQDRLSDKLINLETLQTRIREKKLELGESLFSRDMPGFFRELSNLNDSTLIQNHIDQLKKSIRSDVAVLKTEYIVPLLFITLVFIFLLVFAVWYKKHFARLISVEKFELSEIHLTTIYSPVITVFFVIALLIKFVFPNLPQTFSSLNLVILMIPMVIIVIRLYGSLARSWMLVLITIYVLTFIYELVYYPDIILRMILLLFSLSAFLLFLWMIIKKPLSKRFNNRFAYGLFRTILAGFTLLLFIAITGNLIGAFRMAEFFTLVTIQAVVLAIGIQVTIKVADTIVFLLLASNFLQKLNVFREEFRTVYRKSIGLINFFLWLFFIVTALSIFRVKDPFFEWGREVLTSGWKIGAVDITPGSILIFIFVIWFSVFLSRIIRHILEKDVFARVSTAKGMPSTIILLVRIGLITGGFFLAAAASGMKLTNLSIVIGAFSVGIGFGLQNIFNNMVSGLILAFERPIK